MAIGWTSNDGTVYIIRNKDNKITIHTKDAPLTDEQIDGIYGIILLMSKTGKTLKELLSANQTTTVVENNRRRYNS
jgi:hypothetical protein